MRDAVPPEKTAAGTRLRLCLATHNAHKVIELRALLAQHAPSLADALDLRSLDDLGVHEAAVEDGPDCRSNALIKARHAAQHTGLWSLADDSGLEVDALDGAPGVHSARFGGSPAAGQTQDARNRQVLLDRLTDVPPDRRSARFVCVLCLHAPVSAAKSAAATPTIPVPPAPQYGEGACRGRLLPLESGVGGFGYDPLFVPDTAELLQAGIPSQRADLSFGCLSADEKNRMSHRTRALLALLPALTALVASHREAVTR